MDKQRLRTDHSMFFDFGKTSFCLVLAAIDIYFGNETSKFEDHFHDVLRTKTNLPEFLFEKLTAAAHYGLSNGNVSIEILNISSGKCDILENVSFPYDLSSEANLIIHNMAFAIFLCFVHDVSTVKDLLSPHFKHVCPYLNHFPCFIYENEYVFSNIFFRNLNSFAYFYSSKSVSSRQKLYLKVQLRDGFLTIISNDLTDFNKVSSLQDPNFMSEIANDKNFSVENLNFLELIIYYLKDLLDAIIERIDFDSKNFIIFLVVILIISPAYNHWGYIIIRNLFCSIISLVKNLLSFPINALIFVISPAYEHLMYIIERFGSHLILILKNCFKIPIILIYILFKIFIKPFFKQKNDSHQNKPSNKISDKDEDDHYDQRDGTSF